MKQLQEIALRGSALPLSVMFVAGIILCIATGQLPSSVRNWGYTIAAGVVSSVFSLFGLILYQKQDVYTRKLFEAPLVGEVTPGLILAMFLFVWWSIATGIITFSDPFTGTSNANGYLSTWIGLVASVAGLGSTGAKMINAAATAGPLIGLGAASVVMICATPGFIDNNMFDNQGRAIFALVVACVTLVSVFVIIILDRATAPSQQRSRVVFYVLLLFFLLWFTMACVVTFPGPFREINNGYLGAWGGVFAAVFACDSALKHANGDTDCGVGEAPACAAADAV